MQGEATIGDRLARHARDRGTAPAIVEKMNTALNKVARQPDVLDPAQALLQHHDADQRGDAGSQIAGQQQPQPTAHRGSDQHQRAGDHRLDHKAGIVAPKGQCAIGKIAWRNPPLIICTSLPEAINASMVS